MSRRNHIAAAVALGLGASIGGISAANAAAAFWPYIALGTQVTTVVSVMNTSDQNYTPTGGTINGKNLHYRMYYKQLTGTNDNEKSCQEVNTYLPTSYYDIQTIDLTAHFGALTKGVLFNDPSVNNNWKASGKDYALGRTLAPARAYLVVNNADSSAGSVTGEAFIFDYGTGAVWGYQASTSDDVDGSAFDFFATVGTAMPNPTTVTLMPFAETTTAFFVTPLANTTLGTAAAETAGMVPFGSNSYESTVAFYTDGAFAIYDRDENLVSGSIPVQVRCVGRVEAAELLTPGVLPLVPDGGFGELVTQRTNYLSPLFPNNPVGFDPANADADGESAVEKLEYNAGATFDGLGVPGTFNNGFRLLEPAS
jgi:hypothetical protein